MKLDNQKRIASEVLKVGKSRVWFSPDYLDEIAKAITRDDIRSLIKRNIIQAKPKKGVSRARARKLQEQRKKGRRRGLGSRKGSAKARNPPKEVWMAKVRLQRRYLKSIRNQLSSKEYQELRRKIKGGFFRTLAHLKSYISKMRD